MLDCIIEVESSIHSVSVISEFILVLLLPKSGFGPWVMPLLNLSKYHTYFLVRFPLQSLLCDPNPNSPANSEAARMFSENKREYNRKVREVVEQSWTAD
jgi:hypothetical protein